MSAPLFILTRLLLGNTVPPAAVSSNTVNTVVAGGLLVSCFSLGVIFVFLGNVFDITLLLMTIGFGIAPAMVGFAAKYELRKYPAPFVMFPFFTYCLFVMGIAYSLFGPPEMYKIDSMLIFVTWIFPNGVAMLGSFFYLVGVFLWGRR